MPSAAGFVVLVLGVGLGATLNAAAGFGFSLLTVPLMALAVGPKEAVVRSPGKAEAASKRRWPTG